MRSKVTAAQLRKRVDAAQGRIESDFLIRGVQYLDVFSMELKKGDLAILDGVIVGTDPGLRARRVLDGAGRVAVPGFIDAHVHVESSMMLPPYFQDAVLACGTTSAICDPHEIANVVGEGGIRFFLESAEELEMDLWVMLSSCVPATHLETNGGGTISARQLLSMSDYPRTLGLAEMMNFPGVLNGDAGVYEKLESFSGKVIDGHCPMLRGKGLSAYASVGITSCHESSELEEAREKLSKGIAVWIREGSVAKDLAALSPMLTMGTSTSVGFCTDDRNPCDIATEGHIDHLIRGAIQRGVEPGVAYRSASWTVARHYGLDRGARRFGAIAPGYEADIVLLEDYEGCGIQAVMKTGRLVSEMERKASVVEARFLKDSIRAVLPQARDLEGPQGTVHCIDVLPGKIVTGRSVARHDEPGLARLSVLERYGRGSAPANGYVRGFGTGFRGAIASSVGHDSHNLIVAGSDVEDMRVALASLIECGGGFSVVQGRQVLSRIALPYAGLMSDQSPARLRAQIQQLRKASEVAGCELPEPFLQLAFLSLPVIPSLKLTDKGLVDVDKFQIIDVRAG